MSNNILDPSTGLPWDGNPYLYTTKIPGAVFNGNRESEIPITCSSYLEGGLHVVKHTHDMLNIFKQKRNFGMIVYVMSGPVLRAGEPIPGFYYLKPPEYKYIGVGTAPSTIPEDVLTNADWEVDLTKAGTNVGPTQFYDLLNNETLTLYELANGKSYSDPTKANDDQGQYWLPLDLALNTSSSGSSSSSSCPCYPKIDKTDPKYYYTGSTVGVNNNLTATEIERDLTKSSPVTTMPTSITVQNNDPSTQKIPYIAIDVRLLDYFFIKTFQIDGGLAGGATLQKIVKLSDNQFYLLFRVTGNLAPNGSLTVNNIVLGDKMHFIHHSPISTPKSLLIPSKKYSLIYHPDQDTYEYINVVI